MREIKFRAWDKDVEYMLYSDKSEDDYFFEIVDGKIGGYCVIMGAGDLHTPPEPETYELSEIMQYTGLKDKNGNEIYEGDIIQSNCEMVKLMSGENTGKFKIENYEVRWQEEKGQWGRWTGKKFELLCGLNKLYLLKWYKVIGNIYENPELLDADTQDQANTP